MLHIVNRYYRSVLGTFFIVMIGISMLFFGVDLGSHSQQELYAVKVNDTEVPFAEFEQRKQEQTTRLMQSLGANYQQFAAQLLQGMNQRIVDELIEDTLLEQTATQIGFAPGKEFLPKLIQQFFPSGFSLADYRGFLRNIGSTAPAFEQRIAKETMSMQLRGLIRHVSLYPPEPMVKGLFQQEERKYSLRVIAVSPISILDQVAEPSEDTLKQFYEENIVDYELPPRVRLSYAPIKTESALSEVEVLDEDIELYYVDNERKFREPAQVKIQEVTLNLKAQDIPSQIGVKSLAQDILDKANAGESIAALAEKYSDAARKGETSAWITKGSQGAEFDTTFFAKDAAVGKIALIESPTKIRIITLVEQEPERVKPLEEVREEIISLIQKREAPIYAAEKARKLFEEWQQSDESLEAFAKKNSLELQHIKELTSLDQATKPTRRLLKETLEVPGEEKLLIDIGKDLALTFVDEYRDIETPAFEEVREKVLKSYKATEAKSLAESTADELFELLQSGKALDKKALEEKGATIEEIKEQKPKAFSAAALRSAQVKQAVIKQTKGGLVGSSPYEVNGTHYIIEVVSITEPDPKAFYDMSDEMEKQSSLRLARLLEDSLVTHLKANNDIDIHPAVFDR